MSTEKQEEREYWQRTRGVCILAVVMIHVLAEYLLHDPQVSHGMLAFRQVINFPVPIFIFMAAYFTNQRKVVDIARYYKNRGGGD